MVPDERRCSVDIVVVADVRRTRRSVRARRKIVRGQARKGSDSHGQPRNQLKNRAPEGQIPCPPPQTKAEPAHAGSFGPDEGEEGHPRWAGRGGGREVGVGRRQEPGKQPAQDFALGTVLSDLHVHATEGRKHT